MTAYYQQFPCYDPHILTPLEWEPDDQAPESPADLFTRFESDLSAWHLDVYGWQISSTYALIVDPTDYYRVDATLADVKANPAKYVDYMHDWLNENDEEPGEWDDDWQRQYDMYTR